MSLRPAKAVVAYVGIWFAGTLVSMPILFFVFRLVYPDCAPGEADGQCGLATFMHMLLALFGAPVVGLAGVLELRARVQLERKRALHEQVTNE